MRGRRHRLFQLPYRIVAQGSSPKDEGSPGEIEESPAGPSSETSPKQKMRTGLARVVIEDMRQELREGNRSPFSRRLVRSLAGCVGRGEQAILF